jgi:hypothetical protein
MLSCVVGSISINNQKRLTGSFWLRIFVITIYSMQHYVNNNHRHHGEHSESYHTLSLLEHGQSLIGSEHASLVHQELEELRQFAPLRRSGTRLSTAKKKLSTLVRYVCMSLF